MKFELFLVKEAHSSNFVILSLDLRTAGNNCNIRRYFVLQARTQSLASEGEVLFKKLFFEFVVLIISLLFFGTPFLCRYKQNKVAQASGIQTLELLPR